MMAKVLGTIGVHKNTVQLSPCVFSSLLNITQTLSPYSNRIYNLWSKVFLTKFVNGASQNFYQTKSSCTYMDDYATIIKLLSCYRNHIVNKELNIYHQNATRKVWHHVQMINTCKSRVTLCITLSLWLIYGYSR